MTTTVGLPEIRRLFVAPEPPEFGPGPRAAGRSVVASSDQEPATGRVQMRRSNLDDDGRADLENHGGADMAFMPTPMSTQSRLQSFIAHPAWASAL